MGGHPQFQISCFFPLYFSGFLLPLEEPGEQFTVVFALIATEPAIACVFVCVGGGGAIPHPFPLAVSVTIYAKTTMHCSPDYSMLLRSCMWILLENNLQTCSFPSLHEDLCSTWIFYNIDTLVSSWLSQITRIFIYHISYFGEFMTISFYPHLESLFLSVSRYEWASYLRVWTYTNKTAGRESPEAHFC